MIGAKLRKAQSCDMCGFACGSLCGPEALLQASSCNTHEHEDLCSLRYIIDILYKNHVL